jgi:hypothetical protein
VVKGTSPGASAGASVKGTPVASGGSKGGSKKAKGAKGGNNNHNAAVTEQRAPVAATVGSARALLTLLCVRCTLRMQYSF